MRERSVKYVKYTVLAGVALVLLALGAWLVVGDLAVWIEVIGSAGLVLLVVSALLRPDAVREALRGRQARYGGNSAVMSVAFVAIIVLINYVAARHPTRWDVTEERMYTLSQQTIQILDGLTQPVQVRLFFTPSHYNYVAAEDMIKEYAARSSLITYEFIDPEVQRQKTLEYQVQKDGTIIFEQGNRREVTFGVQEQDFASALLRVTTDKVRGVYFTTGHQERALEDTAGTGYSNVRMLLESENYETGTLNLATMETPPEDLSVLVIAAPQTPFEQGELDRLNDLLKSGVSLFILFEPASGDSLEGFLETYGLVVNDDLIVDTRQAFFGDVVTPLVSDYTYHQITKDLTGASSIFPTARSLTPTDPAAPDWTVEVLIESSAGSWGEQDYFGEQVAQDDDESVGPLALAVAIEPAPEGTGCGRLVVVGDADFASNDVLTQVRGTANIDLFMNAAGWLAEEEDLISIRPVKYKTREVFLSSAEARGIIYGNILFVPLAVLIAGGIAWWRRR